MQKLDDDSNRSKSSSIEKASLLSEYINQNLIAFKYLRNRNYKIAMTSFEKSIDIAKDLDEIKHVESLTNFGVSQFFCGKFTDSYISLDKAREISNRLIENYVNDKSIYM